jgi:hypothetical protein
MEIKECRGCNKISYCLMYTQHIAYHRPCPCQTCLIKGICTDYCAERNHCLSINIHGYPYTENYNDR